MPHGSIRGSRIGVDLTGFAVLFDLDGVIINSFAATSSAIAVVASTALGRPVDVNDCRALAGGSPPKALAALGVAEPRAAYERWFDAAFDAAAGEVAVHREVLVALRSMAAAGASIAVITAQARRRMGMLLPDEVAGQIDLVLTHDDVVRPKPAPDGVEAALAAFAVPNARAVLVGDAPGDMEAARAARVVPIGVTWGFFDESALRAAGATHIVHDPGDLAALVARCAAAAPPP